MKKICVLMLAVLLCLTSACAARETRPYGVQVRQEEMTFGPNSIFGVYDAKIYGFRDKIPGSVAELVYRDLRTGETVSIADVEMFYGTHSVAVFDGYLYRTMMFPYRDKETNADTFRIRLEDNFYEVIAEDVLADFPVYVKEMNGNLLQSKVKFNEEGKLINTIELLDVNSGESTVLISVRCQYPEFGTYIYAFDYDSKNDKIYVLTEQYDNGSIDMILEIYSANGALESSIDASLFDDGRTTRFIEMTVYDEYIYAQNASRKGVIARLENGELRPLVSLIWDIKLVNCLRGTDTDDGGIAVFGNFKSTEMLFFDYKKGTLKYFDLGSELGYWQPIPYRSGDELLISWDSEDGYCQTYISLKDLLKKDLITLPKDENGEFDLSDIATYYEDDWIYIS